jgi:tripartite-type tricarboxylate transporter receptor subunit TctC
LTVWSILGGKPAARAGTPRRIVMKRFALTLVMLAAALVAPSLGHAQAYPAKPVRIFVTLSPGSPSDILARVIAEQLAKSLGQPFVVENRPGAGGNIAGEYVVRQPADGYTLMLATISSHGINPAWYAKMPYDALRDFTPIVGLVASPNVLIVNNDVPVNSVQDLIAWIKAKPAGEVNYASAGNGTSMHMSAELFQSMTGVKMTHVPYKGAPEGVLGVMKGEVTLMFPNASTALSLAESGKVKLLAVTPPKRLSWLTAVPTVAEAVPGFDVMSWYGFVAPAGTPPEVVSKINAESQKALTLPSVREALFKQGFEIMGLPPQEFAAYMQADVDKWTRLVNTAKLPKL